MTKTDARIKNNQVLAQISFPQSHKYRENFIDLIDNNVVLTLVDAETFFGDDGKPESDPDQQSLNGFE